MVLDTIDHFEKGKIEAPVKLYRIGRWKMMPEVAGTIEDPQRPGIVDSLPKKACNWIVDGNNIVVTAEQAIHDKLGKTEMVIPLTKEILDRVGIFSIAIDEGLQ